LFRKMHQSSEHNALHNELENYMQSSPKRQFYHVVAE